MSHLKSNSHLASGSSLLEHRALSTLATRRLYQAVLDDVLRYVADRHLASEADPSVVAALTANIGTQHLMAAPHHAGHSLLRCDAPLRSVFWVWSGQTSAFSLLPEGLKTLHTWKDSQSLPFACVGCNLSQARVGLDKGWWLSSSCSFGGVVRCRRNYSLCLVNLPLQPKE